MSTCRTRCNSSHFARLDAVADPVSAALIRREFSDWLGRYFALDATQSSDMVLAVNEAMANAAEFAYCAVTRPAIMHVQADYDGRAATLRVTVTDHGTWRSGDQVPKRLSRGRGIPLMRALADRAIVDSSPTGTRVCLEWARVPAAAR